MNEPTLAWTDAIDPSTIPDQVVWSELGKRRRARQINAVPGTGRKPLIKPCPHCALDFSARDMRAHEPRCRRQRAKTAKDATARALQRAADLIAAADRQTKGQTKA